MIIKKYKAKVLYNDRYVSGAYFKMCKLHFGHILTEEERMSKTFRHMGHFILYSKLGDDNIDNSIISVEIDPDTLEEDGFWDTEDENY